MLNKPLNQTLKGQSNGNGVQNSISKIIDEQYYSNSVQYDISDQTIIIQNESNGQFKEKNRAFSPDLIKNALNEQLLKINNSKNKIDDQNEAYKESNLKNFRDKMFSVDLNSILRETPKCNSSRPTPQKSRLLSLSKKRQSDCESLTLINVEQLCLKEKLKRTYQIQQDQNDQQFRNTIGISPFKTTFRVKKQYKTKCPAEIFNKRINQLEEKLNDNSFSYSTQFQTEQNTQIGKINNLNQTTEEQQNSFSEDFFPVNEKGKEMKSLEINYLVKKLNEQKNSTKVDFKFPQFKSETNKANTDQNKVFNKVLLKANLNKSQEYDSNKSKSLDQKSNTGLKYSQCQPILQVDNSQQQQSKKKIKKHSKLINHQLNNFNSSSPVKKNSIQLVKVNNSLVIQQSPIFMNPEIKLNYSICYGNNSNLIRRVMQKRQPLWNEISTTLSNYQFRWQPTSQGFNFHSSQENPKYPKVFNHFEFHKHLSDKSFLLFNVVNYCVKNNIDAFEFMPISFYFDFNEEKFEKDLQKFSYLFERLNFYSKSQESKKNIPSDQEIIQICLNEFKDSIEISKAIHEQKAQNRLQFQPKTTIDIVEKQILKQFLQIQETNFLKSRMSENLLSNFNIWVLKPVNLNRGNGITIVQSLKEINSAISVGFEQQSHVVSDLQPSQKLYFNSSVPVSPAKKNKIKPLFYQFILQKYIERPLLFHGRKFDIRIWVLVTYTNKFQYYQSKEGWVRTSGYGFDLKTSNKYIHLTNNAIQKNSEQYGQFENGNSINYATLKKYINSMNSKESEGVWDGIQQKIRNIIKITLQATSDKINIFNREKQFELFGYDFMIDQSFKPWLIEVNTNPCIEESSEVLKQILPRLIDDMLRLTIDQFFSKQTNQNQSFFPLIGYSNEDSIFEQFEI
ncbi:tubulin-tyrosine ligase family protein (macronuclear) [Tetrahymena thermophila SB210]|uniref:Tubulin-tyrosine ligase family protein n=1 Tax=Tetrahymena thermophila (strain SB210) TaxID=312017 RepID=I7M3Y7_TETTS|nr:tubulin-tyrosine ligase family protein [Tetrahymena thermophila SB210]EAS04555.2 tubulin-tyrosine ligase family protein [Tetrahymena thermophila SB210]|eukprot:XP_001024800.2 tubulin-tyrosine ligase family protein [Tetrahymena thermophila SB210]